MDSIRKYSQRKVVFLKTTDTIEAAVEAMCEKDVGCVLAVGPDGTVDGILTDRDAACAAFRQHWDPHLPLFEVMSRDLATVDENATLADAVAVMKEKGIRRVPIMAAGAVGGRCVGLVTLDDLLAAGALAAQDVSEIVKKQVHSAKSAAPRQAAGRARKQQTLSLFHNLISEKMGLPKNTATRVARVIFEDVVRRVTYEEAQDFVSQLPEKWKEELLDLQKGPDTAINAPLLISQVRRILNVNDDQARGIIHRFFEALSEWMNGQVLNHVASQLPRDMQEVTGLHP